jgi:hypothetical protein
MYFKILSSSINSARSDHDLNDDYFWDSSYINGLEPGARYEKLSTLLNEGSLIKECQDFSSLFLNLYFAESLLQHPLTQMQAFFSAKFSDQNRVKVTKFITETLTPEFEKLNAKEASYVLQNISENRVKGVPQELIKLLNSTIATHKKSLEATNIEAIKSDHIATINTYISVLKTSKPPLFF